MFRFSYIVSQPFMLNSATFLASMSKQKHCKNLPECALVYMSMLQILVCTDWNWLLVSYNPLPLLLLLSVRKNAGRISSRQPPAPCVC